MYLGCHQVLGVLMWWMLPGGILYWNDAGIYVWAKVYNVTSEPSIQCILFVFLWFSIYAKHLELNCLHMFPPYVCVIKSQSLLCDLLIFSWAMKVLASHGLWNIDCNSAQWVMIHTGWQSRSKRDGLLGFSIGQDMHIICNHEGCIHEGHQSHRKTLQYFLIWGWESKR